MSEFRFQASDHSYWLGEQKLPGVTGVLSILGGYEGIPKHILDRAAERGTAVHLMTELDDAGTLDIGSLSDEMLGYWEAWQNFKRVVRPTMLDAEVVGYHPTLLYAGTRDRRLAIKGAPGILDIKSSYKLMPSTGPQTAAYAEIYNATAEKADRTKKRWGLRLAKDGSYDLKEYTGSADFNVFLSALNCYRFCQQHNKTKIQYLEELQNEYN